MGIVDCDRYRMLSGDDTAIRNYNGQYLEEYVWAKDRKKQLDEIKAQKICDMFFAHLSKLHMTAP